MCIRDRPVTSSAHILSKLVVYIAWFVIDGISILASLSILFSVNMNWLTFFSSLWDAFVSLGEVLRAPAPLVLLYALVLALAMTASGVLSIYFSASVGSLFNTHKKLGGICCFVGISMALQLSLIHISLLSLGCLLPDGQKNHPEDPCPPSAAESEDHFPQPGSGTVLLLYAGQREYYCRLL